MSTIEPTCKCGRQIISKGLCKRCYNSEWRKANKEKVNDMQKRYRNSHHEKVLEIERKSHKKVKP